MTYRSFFSPPQSHQCLTLAALPLRHGGGGTNLKLNQSHPSPNPSVASGYKKSSGTIFDVASATARRATARDGGRKKLPGAIFDVASATTVAFCAQKKRRPAGRLFAFRYTPRSRSMDRMWPMARVGFSPLGQTLTQFMMPWHRNRLNGSSRRDRRSSVASSRLSARNR